MFWGCIVSKDKSYKLGSSGESPLLHLSNLALAPNAPAGLTSVFASVNGKKHLLASLKKDSIEHSLLDLYFRQEQNVEFAVEGPGQVHISGYFEPDTEGEEEEEDEEEEVVAQKNKPQAQKTQPQQVAKPQQNQANAVQTQKSPKLAAAQVSKTINLP
jgi:hypothetical protein